MPNKKKESEWKKELFEIITYNIYVDRELARKGIEVRGQNLHDNLVFFIRTLLLTQKKEMIEKIMNDEELWEYLRNPIHISVRSRLEYVLQKMKENSKGGE